MKILIISTDRALLGEEVSSGDAINRHRHYGQQVKKLDIIVFSRSGYKTKQLAENIFCYPTNSFSKLCYFWQAFKIARKLFSQTKYDLIVCQDPFLTALAGCLIKRQFGSKLLIHFHGDFWQNKYWLGENPINYLFLLLSKFTLRQADAIRVVSPPIKSKLQKAGLDKNIIQVIPTPVNLDNFKNPDNQMVASLQREFSGKKIILWVGRLTPEKNLTFLFESFASLVEKFPNLVLLILGQGKEFKPLDKLRVHLGLTEQIKMLGHINYKNLVNYYHAADIFVLPSLHESFGKVLLEAATCAKPIVASRTTGARSIIQHKKTGLLVPINNRKQLIDKILNLLTDERLAHQLGAAAYTDIQQRFSYQPSIDRVVRYWHEIVMGLKIKKSAIK